MTARIGIDARLRAYRAGGIAEHVSRLIGGLAGLDTDAAFVVLDHRRAPPAGGAASPAAAGRAFERHRLFTPPHHRLEGWSLPIELWPLRLDLLHSPDVVPPRAWRGASVVTIHDVAFLRRPEFLTADSLRYYAGTADRAWIEAWVRARDASGRGAAPAGAARGGNAGGGTSPPAGGVFRAVRRADVVVVVSDHTRRELVALTDVDPARIHVVPNPVHPRYGAAGDPAADAAVAADLGLARPFILFVSTIEPRKNVATLLGAFRRLLDDGADVDLVLAGADGWHSEAVYTTARDLDLGGRARFLGFVPDDTLAALYRRAAVLAHPAHDEGFGFTPAEAMAAGTPVVVSDAGSLPEVVGDAGLRVPPADAAAWATVLARVLGDPALAGRLRAAGRARAVRFTPEIQARGTLAAYAAALRAHAADRDRRGWP